MTCTQEFPYQGSVTGTVMFLEVLSKCFQVSEPKVLRSSSFDAAKLKGYGVKMTALTP